MAKYAADGAHVTLVTCTAGEEGEVLVPALESLAADREDKLGEHRVTELADAMKALGVADHRFLGGAGHYRDSGMMGLATNQREDAFWRADLLEAATFLVEVIREVKPQVAITYNTFGDYGHPDHIQAHRVLHYASTLSGASNFRPDLGEPWEIDKIYWTAFPYSVIKMGREKLIAAGTTLFGENVDDPIEFGTPDEFVTARIDAVDFEPLKLDAMRAHASQITVDGPFFALSNHLGREAMGTEYFQLVKGTAAPGSDGFETDLFAGLNLDAPSG